jgi:uncharacterized protein involved in type VI secretion and phage assembly
VQFGGYGGGGLIGPDVGDEVLVSFDRGALDHPFVIGGLYNGKDKPGKSDVTSGRVVRHTLADRSNNRVDLLDQRVGGKRGVRVSSGDDRLVINLDRTRTEITVDSKGSVSIKGSRSVSVEAGANLSLKAGGRMSLKTGGVLDIEAGTISARSLGAVAINALAALELNAVGVTTVSGEGALMLTSPLDVTVDGTNVMLLGVVTANGMPVV